MYIYLVCGSEAQARLNEGLPYDIFYSANTAVHFFVFGHFGNFLSISDARMFTKFFSIFLQFLQYAIFFGSSGLRSIL